MEKSQWDRYVDWAFPVDLDPQAVRETFEVNVPGGHEVAALLGDSTALSELLGSVRGLPDLDGAAANVPELAEAAEFFVQRCYDAFAAFSTQIEDLADDVAQSVEQVVAADLEQSHRIGDTSHTLPAVG